MAGGAEDRGAFGGSNGWFVHGPATAPGGGDGEEENNIWAAGFFGLGNAARPVDVDDDRPSYSQDLAAMAGIIPAPSTLMDVVASSSHHSIPTPLAVVPYVEVSGDARSFVNEADGEQINDGLDAATGGAMETEQANQSSRRPDAVPMEDVFDDGQTAAAPIHADHRVLGASPLVDLSSLGAMVASLKVMQDDYVKMRDLLHHIAGVACSDAAVMGKIGSLFPPELLVKASSMLCSGGSGSALDGSSRRHAAARMPSYLELQFDSIGVTCNEKFAATHGRDHNITSVPTPCPNPKCSNNRYPILDQDAVWDFTRWLAIDTSDEALATIWFDCGGQYGFVFTGQHFKEFMLGSEFTLNLFDASILLLRTLESDRFLAGQRGDLRHYLNASWGTHVLTGKNNLETSLSQFSRPIPPCQLNSATMVMVPVRVHGRLACYAIDIEAKVFSVLDPAMTRVSTEKTSGHLTCASLVVKECLHCLRLLRGDSSIGVGQWRGLLLVPKQLVSGVDWAGSIDLLFDSMVGLNNGYACDTDNKVCPTWTRRKLVYNLLNMKCNKAAPVVLANTLGVRTEVDLVTGGMLM